MKQQKQSDQSPTHRKIGGTLIKSPQKSPGRVASPRDERPNKTVQEQRTKQIDSSVSSDALSVASGKRPAHQGMETRSAASTKSPSQVDVQSNSGSTSSHVRNSPRGNRTATEVTTVKNPVNVSPRRTILSTKPSPFVRPRPTITTKNIPTTPTTYRPEHNKFQKASHQFCADIEETTQQSTEVSTTEPDSQTLTLSQETKSLHDAVHPDPTETHKLFRRRQNGEEETMLEQPTERHYNHEQVPAHTNRQEQPVTQQYRDFIKNSPVKKYVDLRQTCQPKTNRPSMQKDRKHSCDIPTNDQQQVKLSDFRFGKCIGAGKFGEVYLAKHKLTGMLVAIKKIGKFAIRQNKMEKQITEEIRLQSFCNNPNIIHLYGYFKDELHTYLILEYATDGTLFNYLHKRGGRLSERETASILKEVVYAVEFLHQNDIAHRDIKPQNILLASVHRILIKGVAKLCDFGWSARVLQSRKSYCGTFDYTPPEILERKEYDESVDLWCLGVLTYELLMGQVPFGGGKDRKAVMSKIINVDKERLTYPYEISADAMSLIEGLIRKDPKERLRAEQLLQHPFFKHQQKK